MGAMEVFLIITAVIVIAVSFCIKEKSDKNEDEKKSGQDEVKAVTQEMIKEEIQNQLAMISDYMLENTEAKLDKIANQKIMAVGNYSEDVLKNIEENHNEVMFLYNMLNDKETTLKNTVRDIEAVKVSVRKMADNVENYILLKSNEEYFTDPVCKNGYFRGIETYNFVRDINSRYESYKKKIKS